MVQQPQWEAIRDHQHVFSNVFAYGRWQFNLAPGDEARFMPAYYVSDQFFPSLGVQPSVDRLLGPADDVRGCSGAAVISHGYWSPDLQNRYMRPTFETRFAATGQSSLRVTYSETLGVLMAISGIVLLIGCANVANLILARRLTREREISTRIALGSSKGALVRQFLIESLLLSAIGTLIAIVLARISVKLLLRLLDVSLSLAPDARVLGFNVGVTAITDLPVGIAPALWSTQVQPNDAMRASSRLPLYRLVSRLALRQERCRSQRMIKMRKGTRARRTPNPGMA